MTSREKKVLLIGFIIGAVFVGCLSICLSVVAFTLNRSSSADAVEYVYVEVAGECSPQEENVVVEYITNTVAVPVSFNVYSTEYKTIEIVPDWCVPFTNTVEITDTAVYTEDIAITIILTDTTTEDTDESAPSDDDTTSGTDNSDDDVIVPSITMTDVVSTEPVTETVVSDPVSPPVENGGGKEKERCDRGGGNGIEDCDPGSENAKEKRRYAEEKEVTKKADQEAKKAETGKPESKPEKPKAPKPENKPETGKPPKAPKGKGKNG